MKVVFFIVKKLTVLIVRLKQFSLFFPTSRKRKMWIFNALIFHVGKTNRPRVEEKKPCILVIQQDAYLSHL